MKDTFNDLVKNKDCSVCEHYLNDIDYCNACSKKHWKSHLYKNHFKAIQFKDSVYSRKENNHEIKQQ